MKSRALVFASIPLFMLAWRSDAQTHVRVSEGEVSSRADASRLTTRIRGLTPELRRRVKIGGDSAQRIAMSDYDWQGRVLSVELDEEDARTFWDVRITPDSSNRLVVRYLVDAMTGGVLGIKEFPATRATLNRRKHRRMGSG